ncbi:MAG: helicase-exonuclease AddAB subunit AddA [Planctomycetota bacterium]|nr:helicase-exonuclease AddAB subunit AddA [Planctomycetota bacterium]
MAEKKINWTDQQKRAIFARGSDILVTASAGTGKTAVLSGRCVNIVSDKSVCPDVWSILVLTFTEMAAEQMRSRIAEQLKDAFLESGDHHLRYQLMLLQAADISTIHSFCKRLITEYFYKLDLDPTFGVIDADEATLLKAEVLEKTIDWAWQQSNLVQALQQLLCRRDLRTNEGFLAKITELNNFLEGVVLRESWCDRAAQLAQAASPFASGLGEKQKQIVAGKLQDILDQLRHAQKLYQSQNPDGNWAQSLEGTHIRPVRQCIELLQAGNWDQCIQTIRNFSKPITRTPGELSEPVAKLLHDAAKEAIDAVKELLQLAIVNPDYLDRVSGSVGSQTRVLVELVRKFDQIYSQAKRSLNCLDFADLERYALRLLTVEGPSEDALIPSETALSLQQRYKYIFVDEYQDINPVQQAILDALSSTGNIFVVGDVKQSIYGWRGAEPQIFLERLKPASSDPANAHSGLRVDLNANFRSAKGILDFVNRIFSRIMTASFANIDYDQSAHLRPAIIDESKGRPAGDRGSIVEFHILDETSAESDSENEQEAEFTDENLGVVTSRRRQAAMIAQRIRQMVGADTGKAEFQIYDKAHNCLRDVQYRDIVVLMRSLAKKANDYVEVLRLAGVHVSCQATAGYFQATEISDMLSLLKVLDNPQRDIELAAVLRSPIFNVSDTELARIKLHSKLTPPPSENPQSTIRNPQFWNCVLQYSESGPDAKLAARLKEILAQIEDWRTLARRGNLADLLWEVYRRTNFLSFVSALPNGQARRANLLKLHDRAIQFEGFATSAGIPSLTRFVDFVEKLLEAGQDWAPAEPETAAGNAVRILSVHKSKGLEFPVVFLAELETKFNKEDIYADILAHPDDTLGLQIIDRSSNSKLRSLAHQVIAEEKLKASLAEEMRILYVATTRAKDRLVLTASQKHAIARRILTTGFFFRDQPATRMAGKPISDWQLRSCQSPLEWLLLGLSDQKVLHDAFETGLAKDTGGDSLFSFKLYNQSQLQQLSQFVLGLKAGKSRPVRLSAQKEGAKYTCGTGFQPVKTRPRWPCHLLSQIKKSLGWQYQFGNAPDLPAKSSVTELTHRSDEYVKFDYSKALDRQPAALTAQAPDLTRQRQADGRLIGTATHLVISHLDLAGSITREAIEKTIEKLLADNAITAAVAERIDAESILAFFQSDLGKIVLDNSKNVLRDWPFTFALPALELPNSIHDSQFTNHESRATHDETIIVQGIIDMLIQSADGLIIIDFKTDNISAAEAPARAELYRLQLNLYARAASAILKSKTVSKWLYFLTPGRAVEIKD